MSKSIKELLQSALKEEGAEGLVHHAGDCGCGIKWLLPYEECPDKYCESAEKSKCSVCGRIIYWPTKTNMRPEERKCSECYYGDGHRQL